MLDACWRRLLVVALLGPTMVVPIPKWHHHAETDAGAPRHADCGLCDLALSVNCVLLAAPPLGLPLLVAAAPERPAPAPPAAPDVEHPARGPPTATH